ncbi:MAG TPA: C39 family peptidase [Candidatus Saccharimonadales bacterium]|jgi:hypothetical protein|nr:C39 family peptidase [Candidatus Saccharimonadales bacterium]
MFERRTTRLTERKQAMLMDIQKESQQWPQSLRDDISEMESEGVYRPFEVDLRIFIDKDGHLDPDEAVALAHNDPDYRIDERMQYVRSGQYTERELEDMNVFADCDLKKTARYAALRKEYANLAQEKIAETINGYKAAELMRTGWRPDQSLALTDKDKKLARQAMGHLYRYYEERQHTAGAEVQKKLLELEDPRIKFKPEAIRRRRKLEQTMIALYRIPSDDITLSYCAALYVKSCEHILETDIVERTQTKIAEATSERWSNTRKRYKENTLDILGAGVDVTRAMAELAIAGSYDARVGADRSRRWLTAASGTVRGHVAGYVTSELTEARKVMREPGPYDDIERQHHTLKGEDKNKRPGSTRRAVAGAALITAGGVVLLGNGTPAAASENVNPGDLTSILSSLNITPNQPVQTNVLADMQMTAPIEGLTATPAATLPNTAPVIHTPETKPQSHEKVAESQIKNILSTIDSNTGAVTVEGKQYQLGDVITLRDGTVIVAAPQYIQFKGDWADNAYFNSTIAHAGCFPTAEATVARTLKRDTRVTPGTMAAFNNAHGVGSGEHDAFFKMASSAGLPIATYDKHDSAKVRAVLKGGGLLIATGLASDTAPFTTAGHAVVIRGIRPDNSLILADPNYHGNDLYSYNKIINGMNNYPVFYAFWPQQ